MSTQRPPRLLTEDDLDELLIDSGPPSEWQLQANAVLIPTPGYVKSYTEIEAELIAGGETVPPGIRMLAAEERSPDDYPATSALKWRPKLND